MTSWNGVWNASNITSMAYPGETASGDTASEPYCNWTSLTNVTQEISFSEWKVEHYYNSNLLKAKWIIISILQPH